MAIERRTFECTSCGHVGLLYIGPPRCRQCASYCGMIKRIDEETARQMLTRESGAEQPA